MRLVKVVQLAPPFTLAAITVTNLTEVEFTIRTDPAHYTVVGPLMHYTIRSNPIDYTVSGALLHYTVKSQPIDFTVYGAGQ